MTDPEPLDCLQPADVLWLEAMADPLPAHLPVDGTRRAQWTRPDPLILMDRVR